MKKKQIFIGIIYFLICFLIWNKINYKIVIEVDSTKDDFSQLFYSKNGIFRWQESHTLPIKRGKNKLQFVATYINHLRWDPVQGGDCKLFVHEIYISKYNYKIKLNIEDLNSGTDIATIQKTRSGVLEIKTTPDAKDPILTFEKLAYKINKLATYIFYIYWIASIVFFILFILIFSFISKNYVFILSYINKINNKIINNRKIKNLYSAYALVYQNPFKIILNKNLIIFISLLLISIIYWFSVLVRYDISIDDEYAIYRTNHKVWIAQGRWANFILTQFLLPQPVLPFLTIFIFCISAIISYYILIEIFKINSKKVMLLAFPAFVAFPTWFYISEFYANISGISAGLIFTFLSFYYAEKAYCDFKLKVTTFIITLPSALMLAFAIGCYQSYLFLYLVLFLSLSVYKNLTVTTNSISDNFLRPNTFHFIVLLQGFGLYKCIDLFCMNLYGLEVFYIDGFWNPKNLIADPLNIIFQVFCYTVDFYIGSESIYSYSLFSFFLIIAIFLFQQIYLLNNKYRIISFITVLFVMLTPFLLDLIAGGIYLIPFRSYVSLPFIFTMLIILTLKTSRVFPRPFIIIVVLYFNFELLHLFSIYSATQSLSSEYDKNLCSRIYDDIVKTIPFNKKVSDYKYDFFGSHSFNSPFKKVRTSTIGSSFYEWDGGNPNRIISFMNVIGYDDIKPISKEKRKELITLYKSMNVYPCTGSISLLDDVILIKLSDRPGIPHRFDLENNQNSQAKLK